MGGYRFDWLAAQISRSETRWGRGLRQAAVLGLAASGLGARRARAQESEPTPSGVPIRVAPQPTPTPERPDAFAVPPTPTVPSSVPREETPTPALVSPPPPPTPTPVQVEEQPGQAEPSIFDPFNPFCRPGPFGPWYPVVAPPDVTAASGIRWYGLQLDDADNTLTAAAFDQDGEELSRGEVRRDGGGAYSWSLSGSEARIEASFAVEGDGAAGRIVGEIGGEPFTLSLGGEAQPQLDMSAAVPLEDAEQRLVGQWLAVNPKFETLFDAFASGDGSPAASPIKCFASGFLLPAAIIGCGASPFGCVGVGVFGGYIWNNCTD